VEEVVVGEPQRHAVQIWGLSGDRYTEVGQSRLLGVTAEKVAHDIDWP